MAQNRFSSLVRYANRQEETFLADTFAYLLNLSLEKEPQAGAQILASLCGEACQAWFSGAAQVSIAPRLTSEEDHPALLIETDQGKAILMLSKQTSCSFLEQLGRYSAFLKQPGQAGTQLTFVTRSRAWRQGTRPVNERFHQVCWYQVSAWLSTAGFTHPSVKFLVRQFLDYLEDKEFSPAKISSDQVRGLPAKVQLAKMLGMAVVEALPEENSRRTAGRRSMGYELEGSQGAWIGFHLREPALIRFEQGNGKQPGFQRILNLQQVDFFSLPAGVQLECLLSFVRESYSESIVSSATRPAGSASTSSPGSKPR